MKLFLKILFLFFLFQTIKIPIFIIQQVWVSNNSEQISIPTINYNIILSKYLPVFIIFLLLILNKPFKKNLLPFFIAFILEVFILDKYLFVRISNFYFTMLVNLLIYVILLTIIYYVYKKKYGLTNLENKL